MPAALRNDLVILQVHVYFLTEYSKSFQTVLFRSVKIGIFSTLEDNVKLSS